MSLVDSEKKYGFGSDWVFSATQIAVQRTYVTPKLKHSNELPEPAI